MTEKLTLIAPEIALFVTTCVVMVLGLSPSLAARKMCAWISGLGLVIAAGLAVPAVLDVQTASAATGIFPSMQPYMKGLIAVVGLMLLPMMSGTVDREMETMIAAGRAKYEALRANRAEFYSFFLFSLTGLMLTVSADDLIWLFLALELTSLPTYIMVTISTRSTRSQEAGVKYFFIGALGAAVFLYGFALLYGATGSTSLAEIHRVLAAQEFGPEGGLSPIAIAGLVISLLGLGVKIAAVPMHFYVADVYQGAAAGVTAMLAFVPKAAGFVAIILLAGAVGWGHEAEPRQLPDALHWTLWIL
ncbi:MAG: proton-conducting transporter membrane subunit, partial [Planctomycetota bacterium]